MLGTRRSRAGERELKGEQLVEREAIDRRFDIGGGIGEVDRRECVAQRELRAALRIGQRIADQRKADLQDPRQQLPQPLLRHA